MHNAAGITYYQPREPLRYLFHHSKRTVFKNLPVVSSRIQSIASQSHIEWLSTTGRAIFELNNERKYK